MWEKDFMHISYLATDEFLEETPVVIPDNVDQFRRNLVFKPLAHHVEVELAEEGSEEGIDLDEILTKVIEEPLPFVSDRSVYFLSPDEVEGLRKEVESEVDPVFIFNITDTLFEILALEKETEPFQDAVKILIKVLDAFLTLGQFTKASELLKRVYIILKTYDLQDWQVEGIGKIIAEAGEEVRVERIGKVLEREEVLLEHVSAYLSLLQKNAIKPLIKLLGELKNSNLDGDGPVAAYIQRSLDSTVRSLVENGKEFYFARYDSKAREQLLMFLVAPNHRDLAIQLESRAPDLVYYFKNLWLKRELTDIGAESRYHKTDISEALLRQNA